MASVNPQFSSLMDDMATFGQAISGYLQQSPAGTQRFWMIPAGYTGGWTFNPVDIPNMGDPFNRTTSNSGYSAEYAGTGENKSKVAMGRNLEICYMGMMERAFRDRHRTPTRALMLLAARRGAHGNVTYGVHKASVEGYVQELLDTS